MFNYYAYGLNFASDIEIPALRAGYVQGKLMVEIRQGELDEFVGSNPQEFLIFGKRQKLFLNIPQVAKFLIENGERIIYQLYPAAHVDEFHLFLLGSCFGALLQQCGYIVLHGNAISLDGKICTVFIGDQGAGKSTTAAWFMQQGARIMCDDVCAITFNAQLEPVVIPGFPQIKIWQDTANKLAINTQMLCKVRPQIEKYAITFHEAFSSEPLPMREIIELTKESGTPQQILGVEKFKKLIAHSYRYYFLPHQQGEVAYHKKLLQLANSIDLKTIYREILVKINGHN